MDRCESKMTAGRNSMILLVMVPPLCALAGGCSLKEATPTQARAASAALRTADRSTARMRSPAPRESKTAATDANLGKTLYQRHCAGCHGERGDGAGPAARFLFPKPRDFRAGRFRLVSTANAQPTLDDIKAVLARGMPGSAMPPWPKVTDGDRSALAQYVVELRRQGIRDREKATAAENGEEFDAKAVEALIKQMTAPGAPIPTPSIPASTAESVARGKERFIQVCAACHGATGKGDGQQKMIDAEGWPDRPRDLTGGIFKGSPDPQSVYRRVFAGMPGTPMPASKWTSEQVIDVVHFVLSLSGQVARETAVLNRERITAAFIDRRLDSLDAAVWDRASPARLRTMPLWWRDGPPVEIEVRAMHSGRALAVRLSWPDPSADRHDAKVEAFADAAAVALSHGPSEPFLGMGSPSEPVDFWFWDADRQSGLPDVDDVNPRLTVDIYPFGERAVETAEYQRPGTTADAQAQPGLPARAVGNPRSAGKNSPIGTALEAAGPGTLTFRPRINQTVQAQGSWHDGRWTVTFVGPLTTAIGPPASLKGGDTVSVSFAVWDGSHHDRDGQKRITIWQDLVLEPSRR
jgi:mono/diheme cytochrome c family protein